MRLVVMLAGAGILGLAAAVVLGGPAPPGTFSAKIPARAAPATQPAAAMGE